MSPRAYAEPWSDWVSVPQAQNPCRGYFKGPTLEPLPANQKVVLEADNTTVEHQGVSLSGNITARFEDYQLTADNLNLRRNPETQALESINLAGSIHVITPVLQARSQSANYQAQTGLLSLKGTEYHYYPRHAQGSARYFILHSDHTMRLRHATFTTCIPRQNGWRLKAKQLQLDPNKGEGYAQHVTIAWKKTPIFYFPFFYFPLDNKRKSGFLYPHFAQSQQSGMELGVPFYWNLAPNYDALFTARWFSLRGTMAQTHFRYLTPESKGQLELQFLRHDTQYQHDRLKLLTSNPLQLSTSDPRMRGLNKGDNRMFLSYNHHHQFDPMWSGHILFQAVKEDQHFIDFSNSILDTNTRNLPQRIEVQRDSDNWQHVLRVERYQNLYPYNAQWTQAPYRRQPQWTFNTDLPLMQYTFFNFSGDMTHFAHTSDIQSNGAFTAVTRTYTTGQRYHVRPKISTPYLWPALSITPQIQWDFAHYNITPGSQEQLIHPDTKLHRAIPLLSLDTRLFLERRISDYTQTLEPRVYMLWVPYVDQNAFPNFDSSAISFTFDHLFRDNRFSGQDRIGDAQQASFAMTTRGLRNSGDELWALSLGTLHHFKTPRVTLCDPTINPNCALYEPPDFGNHHAPISGRFRTQITRSWSARVDWQWQHKWDPNKVSMGIQYRGTHEDLFNIGYNRLKQNAIVLDANSVLPQRLEQAEISFVHPVYVGMNVLGRWHYDLQARQTVDLVAGLERNGCCSAVQFVVMNYLRPNRGLEDHNYARAVFLQVIFKGLTRVGINSQEDVLLRDISGYQAFHTRAKLQ